MTVDLFPNTLTMWTRIAVELFLREEKVLEWAADFTGIVVHHLSVCLSIYLSTYLPTHLPTYLLIYPSITSPLFTGEGLRWVWFINELTAWLIKNRNYNQELSLFWAGGVTQEYYWIILTIKLTLFYLSVPCHELEAYRWCFSMLLLQWLHGISWLCGHSLCIFL